jgi:hypothetical protein
VARIGSFDLAKEVNIMLHLGSWGGATSSLPSEQFAAYFSYAPKPLSVYFLVRDRGGYRYEMSGISFTPQSGCPGETYGTYDNPRFFGHRKTITPP